MIGKPTKVLQVVDGLGMGGAETWLMDVLRLWAVTGEAQMDFLLTGGTPRIFDAEAQALGARIHYSPYGRAHLRTFRTELRRIFREGGYDAVHDHQDYVSGWHFLMGGRLLPPVRVTHVHNPSYQIRNNYGISTVRRLTASGGKALVRHYATHIAGTSKQVLEEYGFQTPHFDHIPNAALHCGFDPARFTGDIDSARASVRREFGWPASARIALVTGRIDQSPNSTHPQTHKNSGFAVSVAIEAADKDPSMRVLFAGHQSAAVPILEEWIETAGHMGRIRFVGVRRDIERLMLASDVLLFPSRGEGLGMVTVEAQAAGLPVLASANVPRECVVVPELVEFKAVEDGAANWAKRLLELTDGRRSFCAANARVAESPFAVRNSAAALLRLYRDGVLA